MIGKVVPLIFDTQHEIYSKSGIEFDTIIHLKSIGLVQFESAGFRYRKLPKRFNVFYYGQPLALELVEAENNELGLGHVLLTKVGQDLAPICGCQPVDGFIDFVKEHWKAHLPEKKPKAPSA
jgi:hypothetical protein